MTILAIYGIGVLIVYILTALPYIIGGDGLELFGLVLAGVNAVLWPIVLCILVWDSINLMIDKFKLRKL